MARQQQDRMGEHESEKLEDDGRDPITLAQHVILNQLLEHYPAHLSKDELTHVVCSSHLREFHVVDALAELLAQAAIHQQGETDCYWLTRPVVYLAELGWSGIRV